MCFDDLSNMSKAWMLQENLDGRPLADAGARSEEARATFPQSCPRAMVGHRRALGPHLQVLRSFDRQRCCGQFVKQLVWGKESAVCIFRPCRRPGDTRPHRRGRGGICTKQLSLHYMHVGEDFWQRRVAEARCNYTHRFPESSWRGCDDA